MDLDADDLDEQLKSWQHYYDWNRPHGSIDGKTPIERFRELSEKTLVCEDIEQIQEQKYQSELTVRQLKQCL